MDEFKAALRDRLAEIASKHKVDPFSREFIFGGNEAFARLRNQVFASGPSGRVTLLSALFKYGLDETKRAQLFPDHYHLGSPKHIPLDKLTLVDLAKRVRREKDKTLAKGTRAWENPETLKKEFESISSALKEITGMTFRSYEHKQNTLRVIYLIDRMMPSSGFPEERERRILTLFKTPTRRFSYEFRDAYPISESEGNTLLINDFKAYFAIEIDNELQDRIDSLFHSIIDRLEEIRAHLDKVAYSSGNKLRIAEDYRSIHAIAEAIDIATPGSCCSVRLDIDMYLQLTRLEVLHFAGAHTEVMDAAKPPSSIQNIQKDIVEALSVITGGTRTYENTTEENLWLEGLKILTVTFADLFLDLIEKALGYRLSRTTFERSVMLSNELLYRIRIFGAAGVSPYDPIKVSFRSIVSALCATSQALTEPTSYRPRVFGDDSQTRSIITPLESPIDFAGNPPKEIAEGYLQIWHNRREMVQDALEGSQEISELKFSLRSLLWSKVVECVQPFDVAVIEENFLKLETRLLSLRPGSLGA